MRSLLALLCTTTLLAAPAAGQDLSGTYDVSGTDPQLGPYAGGVSLRALPTGDYEALRLVEVAQRLPDGRALVLSWRGTARVAPGGVSVEVPLRRQDFVAQLGGLVRGPQDRTPLVLSALLAGGPLGPGPVAPGTRFAGTFASSAGAGPAETWTRAARVPAPHPGLERRLDPMAPTMPRGLMFLIFRSFHALPAVAPYVPRPEFQAAVHFQLVDDTARDYARAHPDHLLVVEKVPDAIGLLEEDLRASALRHRLVDKALGWDRAMLADHVEPLTGMLGGIDPATRQRYVHGDSCLHQGVWVASQAWRFQATGDGEALRNVELGLGAILRMVDAPGRPDEFGRAVQDAAVAPTNGWARSQVLPGIAYIPGGNNDMMHGVEYGFVAAERVLPAGHPLLAEAGRRALSLVTHHRVARGRMHEILLSGVAARLTGDAGMRDRYRRRALWSPLELLWLASGDGIPLWQEVGGRSGPHLATCTFASYRLLGGASPGPVDRLWRAVADMGLRQAFDAARVFRPGNLAAVAAAAGAPHAAGVARDVLAEVPYPRPEGGARIDWSIDPAFCLSPYPALPWKLDWTRDPGRQQSLVAYPLWTIGESDNYWKEGPFHGFRGQHSAVSWSRQDWLHAYWYARSVGALGPND